ncbi:MAG: NACHT domain-containing protein [Succiniclasticum sp.]|uniref:NACHT domain-containing protein n=1 Tax=Succiniclasticum sp. TaxID=2775030 RepID=UPI002A911C2E|nr:NACHT domain-containing protein [Succiniclasticum sp.]MDY6291556.1 NACHT domain-containing protein [Succiniclasticum sp.]
MRDDFPQAVKDKLAKRSGYICNNPTCRHMTVGAGKEQNVSMIGVAAHICAAAPGGKRYDANMTSEERSSIDNGIWLCQNCAHLIDTDEKRFTVELLKDWKDKSEQQAHKGISSAIPVNSAIVVSSTFAGDTHNQILSASHSNIENAAIDSYLQSVYSKFNTLKTLLYTEMPRPFYEFYVCNDVFRVIRKKNNRSEVVTISDITVEKLSKIGNFIILSGTGGLGKSMMMRHFLLSAIKEYDKTGILPLFIALKDFNDSYTNLEEYVFVKIKDLWTSLTKEQFAKLLCGGNLLLLFDGLDEIHSAYFSNYENSLESFIDRYPKNKYIISSRPIGSFVSFARFIELHLKSFTKLQALELVDKIDFRPDEPSIKEKFRQELECNLFYTHKEFASNPLLLSIMLMTFEQFAEIPSKMHVFYNEAYVALSQKHDASKASYHRIFRTGLTADQFSDCFAEFCYRTYFAEKFELSREEFDFFYRKMSFFKDLKKYNKTLEDLLYDLCTNLCLMYLEGNKYHFTHRSFQEYFSALYFSRLPDSLLNRVGQLFEKSGKARYGDNTFAMLYDMTKSRVEEVILIPFLENLFRQCNEYANRYWKDSEDIYDFLIQGNFDIEYWGFLTIIYPDIEVGNGDISGDYDANPNSYLYRFLLSNFDCRHTRVDADDFNDMIDEFHVEDFYYIKDEDDEDIIVNEADIPNDYGRWDGHDLPELAGELFSFSWDNIFEDPIKYEDLINEIESEVFPLRQEFQKINSILREMKRRKKNSYDDFLIEYEDDVF